MAAEAWSGSIRPAFHSYNLLSRDSDRVKDWTKVFTICCQVNWTATSLSLLSHMPLKLGLDLLDPLSIPIIYYPEIVTGLKTGPKCLLFAFRSTGPSLLSHMLDRFLFSFF